MQPTLLFAASALVALVAVAGSAAADVATNGNCAIVDNGAGLVGYQNACLGSQDGWQFVGPGYDYSYQENRLASTSMAFIGSAGPLEVLQLWGFDSARQYAYLFQDEWEGGSSEYSNTGTEVSSVRFVGLADQTGSGYYLGLTQDDYAYESCFDGQCYASDFGYTQLYGSAYTSVRGGPSAGVGASYAQSTSGEDCSEYATLYLDALVVFVPVPLIEGQPCTAEVPNLYEEYPFPEVPVLLPPL